MVSSSLVASRTIAKSFNSLFIAALLDAVASAPFRVVLVDCYRPALARWSGAPPLAVFFVVRRNCTQSSFSAVVVYFSFVCGLGRSSPSWELQLRFVRVIYNVI